MNETITKEFFNQIRVTSKHFLVMLLFLVLLVSLSQASAHSTTAQEPDDMVYLPLIVNGGTSNSPTGPYAQMLQMAQQRCAATGLNQVCYVNGQVTLQPKTGTIPFGQPGALADLTNVQSISLASNGPDIQQWGMAWLRLRADFATPDQELTVLAFGNVQISDIIPFVASRANMPDTVTLPSLQFASSPVAGVTKWGSSGLIVTNPADEDILSLTLNGAGIALGSTAFVEAQPGSKMTVTMMTGSSLTEVGDQNSTAVQGQQVSVPLDQNGQAAGSPTAPTTIPSTPEPMDESLVPLPLTPIEHLVDKLNRAIDRCRGGRMADVYNVLYRIQVIERNPLIKSQIDPARLAQVYNRAPQCLSFEVEFDSTVTSWAGPVFRQSHVRTTGLPVKFLVTGQYIAINQSLDYLSFAFIPPAGPCTPSTSTTPGTLTLSNGSSLKIAVNQVKITTSLRVVEEAKDMAVLNCPAPLPPISLQDNWWTFFFDTHSGLLGQDLFTFRFNDWKYTANISECGGPPPSQSCTHFGEASYEFEGAAQGIDYNATTHLILLHTPEP